MGKSPSSIGAEDYILKLDSDDYIMGVIVHEGIIVGVEYDSFYIGDEIALLNERPMAYVHTTHATRMGADIRARQVIGIS